ncbi:hypothetical protein [Streptomyces xiamenensis]|uniref:hypothetical protein n=1 Tax=Streptomyces xiamenensis TaxID=408015 RepID=UPI003D707591
MNGDRTAIASARGAVVPVTASPELLDALARVMSPYIAMETADAPVTAPRVRVVDDAPRGEGWRRIALRSEYEPDRVLWVDDTRRHLALPRASGEWTLQQLLRSVRHLVRWQSYARGDLFLHGGLVRAAGTGIAFLGHKRSGKTSSVLSALLNGGADFVSNDDLVLTEDDDSPAALTGYGSPRTINIRTDVLLELARTAPALRDLLTQAGHPTNAFPGRHHTRDAIRSGEGTRLPGSVWVRCAELARVTGRPLVSEAPVDVVVLPRFGSGDGGPAISRIGPDEALRALSEHVEGEATKYDPFLAAWYPHTDGERRTRLLRRLAARTPCYRLTQDMERLDEATSVLLRTVRTAGAAA